MEKLSVIMHTIFYNHTTIHSREIDPGVRLAEIKDFQFLKIELTAISVELRTKDFKVNRMLPRDEDVCFTENPLVNVSVRHLRTKS